MALNSAKRMHFALGFKVGGMRLFRCRVLPEVVTAPIDSDLSKPRNGGFMFPLGNPEKTASSVRAAFAHVLLVFGFGRASQIGPSVVSPIPVDMVNFMRRPFSGHVEPRKAVRLVRIPVEPYRTVFLNGLDCSGCGVGMNCIRHPNAPRKHTSLGIVMKNFAHALRGKIGLSHDAPVKRIGQRPVSVSSTCGLRHFNVCAGASDESL